MCGYYSEKDAARCVNEMLAAVKVLQIQIQIQMGICRARLTNCPGALTNVRMLCETGEL